MTPILLPRPHDPFQSILNDNWDIFVFRFTSNSWIISFRTLKALLSSVGFIGEGIESLINTIDDSLLFNNEDLTDFLQNVSDASSRYQVDDDIDNDGDGLIDEEILNGEDDDHDGITDEDVGIVPVLP